MKLRVLVLGAGFGGLELTSILSDEIGDKLDLTLIDKNDSFIFGFSKLDLMFGRKPLEEVRLAYRNIVKPGVKFCQETITSIDPQARRVITDKGTYDADVLVIALGADYDVNATPGLAQGGHEFYTVAGAERLRDVISNFSKGHAVIGVTSTPYKCPPAPTEAAMLLHDYLLKRGLRDACTISLVIPSGLPIPPSPEISQELIEAFAERGINFIPERYVTALDPKRCVAILDDNRELPYDLFLGVPKHQVPQVVAESGLVEDGWIPVERKDLKTRYPGVYAIGDVTSVGTSKAGVYAEGAARIAAAGIVAEMEGKENLEMYKGIGTCYVEFGDDRVARVDMDFFSGPSPTGNFAEPSDAVGNEKKEFAAKRRARWFGL
ncbi:MAG: FAD-dependent oxidoreductase [Anaerolineales bacterium]|nr:FAD-dependent oxidoreductase [Anaerolineales bacterium]